MKKFITWQLIAIFVFAAVLGFISLPYEYQEKVLPSESEFLQEAKINLGLDLQGGTQLDYKIDLRQVEEADRDSIVEGVKEVITRRVDGLGVSEPSIYVSHIADEYHIIVELAGIKDLDEAKSIVGKTIQLEFKEQSDVIETDQKTQRLEYAEAALTRALEEDNIELVGQEDELAYSGIAFYSETELTEVDAISAEIAEAISGYEAGDIVPYVIEGTDGYTYDFTGSVIDLTGYFVVQVTEHTTEEYKEVQASHILIGWEDSDLASDRSQEEAYDLALEVIAKTQEGEEFAVLAEEYSEDEGTASTGGQLGYFGPNAMVDEFEETAFAMEIGDVSDIVETQFGYHIINVTDIKDDEVKDFYALKRITYSTIPDSWESTELTGEHFVRADVSFDQNYSPYVTIEFNEEGALLFEEITGRNINKPLAIFVGGDMISAPNVNDKISGGSAIITGDFSVEEATELARDLNTGAIPAPIILAGQYTIGASLGAEALDSSMKAGIIGLFLLGLYMLVYYRLPGLMANIALGIYAIILIFAIKIALPMAVSILISLGIFGVITAVILKSKDSGWEKLTMFILACFILFFMAFVFTSSLTLTLAGIAGVVLSIGMAVDANVLIFERIKEELRNGKPHALAIETGFQRAWDSIRDSNFSSLLTCGILLYFGSSIIRGFAFNLALGILISMFTAITITRTFLRSTIGHKALESDFLFGINRERKPYNFNFIKNTKIWATISGVMVGISLIVLPIFGLNLGLDFTGGTLMEVAFEEEVQGDQLADTLGDIENELNSPDSEFIGEAESTILDETNTESILFTEEELESTSETNYENTEEDEIEFGTPVIVSTGDGSFIIRIKHISEATHEHILSTFTNKYGSLEEVRFTTVGPTIGETLKKKAILALGIALIMIVLYIAFAFRKVPRKVGAWRFGACAIVALTHDILIILGVFVLLGQFMGVEIDALFITALLTILGFSVHDTIVVFDRTRENLRRGEQATFRETANTALNQTLARSINTSISTLFTLVALLLFGAVSIHYFVLALVLGILVGTYSSIFVATPLLVWWHDKTDK